MNAIHPRRITLEKLNHRLRMPPPIWGDPWISFSHGGNICRTPPLMTDITREEATPPHAHLGGGNTKGWRLGFTRAPTPRAPKPPQREEGRPRIPLPYRYHIRVSWHYPPMVRHLLPRPLVWPLLPRHPQAWLSQPQT